MAEQPKQQSPNVNKAASAPKADKGPKIERFLVRVANTDLKGEKNLFTSLTSIKGISHMFANMVLHISKVDSKTLTGNLTEKQVEAMEKVIFDPIANGAPVWMVNRRNDYETGENKHLLGGDRKFAMENDIKRLKTIRAYRGYRHAAKLPSRGQRTKSNFRRSKSKGKGGLGVKRKK